MSSACSRTMLAPMPRARPRPACTRSSATASPSSTATAGGSDAGRSNPPSSPASTPPSRPPSPAPAPRCSIAGGLCASAASPSTWRARCGGLPRRSSSGRSSARSRPPKFTPSVRRSIWPSRAWTAVSGARSPGTLLAALLDHLSDAELYDELKAFLVAGHTTTASALAWTWYVLSEHPEARGQIEQESRDVLVGRAPGAGDLPRLGYTRRVIEEVLRLYPPTWLTARTAAEDDELGGYRIPAGALILLSPYVTHRHL